MTDPENSHQDPWVKIDELWAEVFQEQAERDRLTSSIAIKRATIREMVAKLPNGSVRGVSEHPLNPVTPTVLGKLLEPTRLTEKFIELPDLKLCQASLSRIPW